MIAALPLVSSALSMLTGADGPTAATSAARTAGAQGADFGQVLAKMSSETVDSVKHAETLSISGLEGKANVQSVVSAVMTAQENLQTALAIRDKAVAAFTEVTHMAI